ncbi:MAG: RNA polymerase sigma factor [Chloroflexota bacterium]|nr:MAG: RNA polymerase subunit sigma-24 [Chloroflexota bacterium]
MAIVARHWAGAQRHEAAGFEKLFLEEYSRVVAIAQHVVRDPHEAEDVAQEVFCAFYRQHPPDASYARAWLRRAAAHTALNTLRGKRRRREREAADALHRDRLSTEHEVSLDPQRALEQTERQLDVRRALSRLPERRAAVLVLRYSGLSYAEVAEALGVSTGQVGTLLRRAEQALEKEISHETSR